jgi:hypothetical protein
MEKDYVDVLGILIKNLNKMKYHYSSKSLTNVYLTSFKYPKGSLIRTHIVAKAIEELDQEKEFKEAINKWSGGRALNPKLMTAVSTDGIIDVNLLFETK